MNAQARKYQIPDALRKAVSQKEYDRWLFRKAAAHVRRDRKRGNRKCTQSRYKWAIHVAVVECKGLDAYTGKPLRWDLIRTYNNEKSKRGGRKYKSGFADLPTVDHVGDGKREPEFKICSWKVNDAKGDLALGEFLELCQTVLTFHRCGGRQG